MFLVLLNVSAAFDTVSDHILLRRLALQFGINRNALHWLASYLHGRFQSVLEQDHHSGAVELR